MIYFSFHSTKPGKVELAHSLMKHSPSGVRGWCTKSRMKETEGCYTAACCEGWMDQVNEPDLTFSRAISVTSRGNILWDPTFVSTYCTLHNGLSSAGGGALVKRTEAYKHLHLVSKVTWFRSAIVTQESPFEWRDMTYCIG